MRGLALGDRRDTFRFGESGVFFCFAFIREEASRMDAWIQVHEST